MTPNAPLRRTRDTVCNSGRATNVDACTELVPAFATSVLAKSAEFTRFLMESLEPVHYRLC